MEYEYKLTLGQRLKKLRKEKGLSIMVAARMMYISQGVLSDYERDNKKPGADALQTMASFYNVSSDYLLELTNSPTTDKDIQFICDYTGLSEETVLSLHTNVKRAKDKTLHLHNLFSFKVKIVDFFYKKLNGSLFFDDLTTACDLMNSPEILNANDGQSVQSLFVTEKGVINAKELYDDIGCHVIGKLEYADLLKYNAERSLVNSFNAVLNEYNSAFEERKQQMRMVRERESAEYAKLVDLSEKTLEEERKKGAENDADNT